MKLRAHHFLLTLATLLPVVLFAVYVATLLVERERDTFRRGAADRARAIMTAADARLESAIAALQALAASRELDRDDLRGFHEEAERLLRTQDDWYTLHLALPSGQQLLNARRPFGDRLPVAGELASLRESVARRRPVVGVLVSRPLSGELAVPVRVPVIRDGEVRYVLSAALKPQVFTELLEAQKVPGDWTAAVLDGADRIVGRSRDAERFIGSIATDPLRQALKGGNEGWFEGVTQEGDRVHAWFQRSPSSGWAVALGVRAAVFEAPARRTLWIMLGGVAIAIGVAFVFASVLTRRIGVPLASLAGTARAIGRGETLPASETSIAELRELGASLNDAATAVREREASQQRAEAALRSADRAKDEFLAMLGHELRNPLSAIASASEVLRRTDSPELMGRARGVIERQVGHMTRLLEDLLEVSRVTRGKVSLLREPVDLAALIGRLLDTWRASGRLARHRVTSALEPVWVDADAARVEQIASNLLDNALKYTPRDGEIRIEVRADGDAGMLRIADTGVGLTPDLRERMFDLFVQGERALDRPPGGLGIGLTLVKRLTELHGGRVEGTSAGVGEGSVFTVWLPTTDAPPAQHAAAPHRLEPMRVLVIEDNDDARAALVQALRMDGHEVLEAADGPRGLAAAVEMRPDLVLLDIGLPEMDGYAVARALRMRQGAARTVLVAISGYGQPEDPARMREAGIDAYLMKPVSMDRLAATVAGIRRGAAVD